MEGLLFIKNTQQNKKDSILIAICAGLLVAIWFLPVDKIFNSLPHKYINSAAVFGFNIILVVLSLVKTWLVIIISSKLVPIIKTKCSIIKKK